MLKAAEMHLRQQIRIPLEVTCLPYKMQEMPESQWQFLEQTKPIWFANISLSLHHMMRVTKVPLFQRIRTLSRYCLFGEAN